jgi:hypothetical protein
MSGVTYSGSSHDESIEWGIGTQRVLSMIAPSNAHTAARPRPYRFWRSHHVATHNAESSKFELTFASHASSRPSRAASIVAVFDCPKGGALK